MEFKTLWCLKVFYQGLSVSVREVWAHLQGIAGFLGLGSVQAMSKLRSPVPARASPSEVYLL